MGNQKTYLALCVAVLLISGIFIVLTLDLSAQRIDRVSVSAPDQYGSLPGMFTDVPTPTVSIHLPMVPRNIVNSLPEKIAFETPRDGNYEIYVMNPDGSGVENWSNHPAKDVAPAWSPDGRRMAFVSDRDGNDEVYVANRDGTGLVRLTNDPAKDRWPTWAPDGSRIAFQSERTGNWEIWVMNADGSDQTPITNHPGSDRYPDWSPDGTKITFTSRRVGFNKKNFTMDPDGGNVALLSDPDEYYDDFYPTWSKDGRITFVSDRPAPSDGTRDDEIYIMSANGGYAQQLTDNDAEDTLARWAPDGTQFAFYSDRDGNKNIYVKILADGSEIRITDHSDDEEYPAWSP